MDNNNSSKFIVIHLLNENKLILVKIDTITNDRNFDVDNYVKTNYPDQLVQHYTVNNVEVTI